MNGKIYLSTLKFRRIDGSHGVIPIGLFRSSKEAYNSLRSWINKRYKNEIVTKYEQIQCDPDCYLIWTQNLEGRKLYVGFVVEMKIGQMQDGFCVL